MKKLLCLFLISAIILSVCAACAENTGNSDLEALLNAITAAGFEHEISEITWDEDLLTGKAETIIVRSGEQEEHFTVYSYSSNSKAQADTKIVNESGHGFNYRDGRGVQVSWISYPHFFIQGRIIVFYVGNEAWVLDFLSNTLGEPFAGTGQVYSPPQASAFMDKPPAILLTADGEELIYSAAPNMWNGSIYDRTDLIRDMPFLRENSAVLETGAIIAVEVTDYEHRPDNIRIQKCFLDEDGDDIAEREEVLFRQTRELGVYRFDFPFEKAETSDVVFIGYRMFFYWDNEFSNEAEYAFVVLN
ncbi:MAG: hypothetical protein FWD48_08610 [Oscillospiraceae bacterium]|nr:hypothetical protein [Oscillospiraceae bacterium]